MEETLMKKRIISIMLVLAFALLALPASTVSAGEATVGEATYTGKFEDGRLRSVPFRCLTAVFSKWTLPKTT